MTKSISHPPRRPATTAGSKAPTENDRPNRKLEKKRAEIIHAAIEVINDRGYAQSTMTDIAASLDLRDAALYYYFESKQALAHACHLHSLGIFERLLDEAQASRVSGYEKIDRFIRSMLEDSERHGPQLYFGDYTYLADAQRLEVKNWADRLTAVLEGFFDEGMADGSIVRCEPHVVVQLLLGMLIWLAKWVPAIEGMTVDRLMSAIRVASLDGLAAKSKK